MVNKVLSASFNGLDCQAIEVQVDVSNGFPSFNIVGLTDTSIQESKERVRSSIINSGYKFPTTRKTINLAPAQLRKHGSIFDLAIALGILISSKQIQVPSIEDSIILGELSLNGNLNKIPGVLPITQYAKQQNYQRIILPSDNADEASFIKGINIIPVKSLLETIDFLQNGTIPSNKKAQKTFHLSPQKTEKPFEGIIGQHQAKRALSIAVAGRHNILIKGSPGCGKTLLSKSVKSLLPPMSKEEILDTTKIFSVVGNLSKDQPLINRRPFREVHHTASISSLIGGGRKFPQPGEISLAHNGILFLDEISEFQKHSLEALRQPMEDKFITINRVEFTAKFPCNFMLIATTNPCPCGYYLDKKYRCNCSQRQIDNYQKKISGPLIDRFDLFLNVQRIDLSGNIINTNSDNEIYKEKIHRAHKMQENRYRASKSINRNKDMDLPTIREFCKLDKKSEDTLKSLTKRLNLSNRSYLKVLRVSRTIADLEESPQIQLQHILEASQYR
ncbi:magnesium chelatase [Candidatus Peregrinibacteria bacterium HGW-Peregrinibacteria-1]|jgi:magnesium chelatase family protein|nr:MAG: magnesium chelatase [Candidatus Peregrinibacteria bacterium HGW-Peregrinibacteria-1]